MRVLFIIIYFIPYCTSAQTHDYREEIQKHYDAYHDAIKNKDFPTAVNFVYPAFVEMLGGKDAVIAFMENPDLEEEEYDDEYVLQETQEVSMPDKIYKAGNELHGLITTTTITKMQEGTSKYSEYTIAVSQDGGQSWYFMDMASLDPRKIFPAWNEKLVIPEEKEIFISDDHN